MDSLTVLHYLKNAPQEQNAQPFHHYKNEPALFLSILSPKTVGAIILKGLKVATFLHLSYVKFNSVAEHNVTSSKNSASIARGGGEMGRCCGG